MYSSFPTFSDPPKHWFELPGARDKAWYHGETGAGLSKRRNHKICVIAFATESTVSLVAHVLDACSFSAWNTTRHSDERETAAISLIEWRRIIAT